MIRFAVASPRHPLVSPPSLPPPPLSPSTLLLPLLSHRLEMLASPAALHLLLPAPPPHRHHLAFALPRPAPPLHASLPSASAACSRRRVRRRAPRHILYTSVCLSDLPNEPSDFFPLLVHYQERLSAAGRTSGGFFKREGKAKDHEVLICRLIDRPLRPTMPKGFYYETQILSWVFSYDGIHSPDCLAITAAGIAVALAPYTADISGDELGYVAKDGSSGATESLADIVEDEVIVDGEVDEGDVHIKPVSRSPTVR
ncbi:hypothetical protein EJB05_15101, partial [Eragrostis curvula]